MIVYGKTQSSTLLQDVQAVLKHPDYPDSLGKAVLINSIHEKQKLSAVGLRTVMAKTKEFSEVQLKQGFNFLATMMEPSKNGTTI